MSSIVEQVEQEVREFEMPPATQGMVIRFYQPGTLDPGTTTIGFVQGVARSGRSINVAVPGRGVYEQVRHLSDPKLKASPEQRENGAWDYTPHHREAMEYREALNQRLERIEDALRSADERAKK